MKPVLNICVWVVAISITTSATAAPAIANAFGRKHTSLNGQWKYIVDPYDTGYRDYRQQLYDAAERPWGGYFLDQRPRNPSELIEYSFDDSPEIEVPGDWNSQDEKLFYYEGTVWYRRKFDDPRSHPESRVFVYFGAANYESDAYLNGRKLGKHVGGFTPFNYEITSLLRATNNSLVVRVNSQRKAEGVPTVNTDWWNYGGLTRDVLLVEVPATFILDYTVRLKGGTTNVIEAEVQLDGPAKRQTVRLSIPGLNVETQAQTDSNGIAKLELPVQRLGLWSPESPVLHEVSIASETDRVSEKIGFRTIETRGTDVVLNGKPVYLRGICMHEENPLEGRRAWSVEDARLLLGWAKELNCNFVRLAHYPHNENMTRVADEMGLMVWAEIPVYWTIHWTNSGTLNLAKEQLADMIERDKNRASVVVWSVANETPVSAVRTAFLKELVDTARALDGTRLVSAAMEVRSGRGNSDQKIVDDPFGEFTDLLSFNQYIGWYDGTPEKLDRVSWTIRHQKPALISEFGADAKQGLHGDARARFTEEYQEDLYRRTVSMLKRIPGFAGTTPWILADFRSPRRPLPGIQDGWNRKGLIGQNGRKKAAFGVLKKFYDELEREDRERSSR